MGLLEISSETGERGLSKLQAAITLITHQPHTRHHHCEFIRNVRKRDSNFLHKQSTRIPWRGRTPGVLSESAVSVRPP